MMELDLCKEIINKKPFDIMTIGHFMGGIIIGLIFFWIGIVDTITGIIISNLIFFIGWEFYECFIMFGKPPTMFDVKSDLMENQVYCGDSHRNVVIDLIFDVLGYMSIMFFTINWILAIVFMITSLFIAIFFILIYKRKGDLIKDKNNFLLERNNELYECKKNNNQIICNKKNIKKK